MGEIKDSNEYRERLERLAAELERPKEELAPERTRLRDDIVSLFRELETRIEELQALKDQVRPLVDRYREMFARAQPPPPLPRVDHLGSSTYRERGWSALAGGEYERAIGELEKALSLDPDNLSSLAMLAWAHLRLENWEDANTLLIAVLGHDPEHSLGRTCKGYLLLCESRYEEAIERLAGVAEEGTDRTASLYANLYLGVAYSQREMYEEARSYFERALELGPNLTEAYWELGRSRQREGREDLALESWKTGAENRYNPWGERCRAAVEELEAASGA